MKIQNIEKASNKMIGELYNTRKDVTRSFEFDYVRKLQDNYNILKNGSCEWILEDKQTNQQYFLTIKTKKTDINTYLNEVIVKEIKAIYQF